MPSPPTPPPMLMPRSRLGNPTLTYIRIVYTTDNRTGEVRIGTRWAAWRRSGEHRKRYRQWRARSLMFQPRLGKHHPCLGRGATPAHRQQAHSGGICAMPSTSEMHSQHRANPCRCNAADAHAFAYAALPDRRRGGSWEGSRPGGVNVRLAALRSLYDFARRMGIPPQPGRRGSCQTPPAANAPTERPFPEQIRALMDATPNTITGQRDRAAILASSSQATPC